jgi:hypothetical protein
MPIAENKLFLLEPGPNERWTAKADGTGLQFLLNQ